MHRRQLILGLAAALALPAGAALAAGKAPPVAPASASPEAVVRNLYARYGTDAPDYMADETQARRYFTKTTFDLIKRTFEKSERDQEPGIDYDPLIDGQDGEVKNLTIATTGASGDKATIEARFTSFDLKIVVTFDMRKDGDAWRIEDIRGRDGSTLRGLMVDYLK